MSVKRTKVQDGAFISEFVTFEASWDEATLAELSKAQGSVPDRIRWLEQYLAAQLPPTRAARLPLERMQEALAGAKRNKTRDAVLMAVERAVMCWRELEALRFTQLGVETVTRLRGQLAPAAQARKEQAAKKRANQNPYKADLQKEALKERQAHLEMPTPEIRARIAERFGASRAMMRKIKVPRARKRRNP